MAIRGRVYPSQRLIHHPDRGIQYCGDDYQNELKKNNILMIMRQLYDPYTNTIAERVNGIIKGELEKYAYNNEIFKPLVADIIETYNKKRPHFTCHMLTSNQMHKQHNVRIKTYKKTIVHKDTLVD
jgi:putative transposase